MFGMRTILGHKRVSHQWRSRYTIHRMTVRVTSESGELVPRPPRSLRPFQVLESIERDTRVLTRDSINVLRRGPSRRLSPRITRANIDSPGAKNSGPILRTDDFAELTLMKSRPEVV
jgi:hypothetical protein